MKVHIFHYKWPGIKEGLVYATIDIAHSWQIEAIKAPADSYLLVDGSWYIRLYATKFWVFRVDERVPNEIRATALLLT